jgi:hypothetical protein
MVLDSGNTLDQHQHQHQQQRSQQKRCCGTAQNPAPGELKSDEVATYLHNLSAHMSTSQLEHASTVLSTEGWQVRTLAQNLHSTKPPPVCQACSQSLLEQFLLIICTHSQRCAEQGCRCMPTGPRLPASSTAAAARAWCLSRVACNSVCTCQRHEHQPHIR